MGVGSGYTQQDVQNLARVLTGVGINAGDAPHVKSDLQALPARRRLRIQSGAARLRQQDAAGAHHRWHGVWRGRAGHQAHCGGNSSIAFTDALPLSFEGTVTVPNLSLKSVGEPTFDERQSKILSDM